MLRPIPGGGQRHATPAWLMSVQRLERAAQPRKHTEAHGKCHKKTANLCLGMREIYEKTNPLAAGFQIVDMFLLFLIPCVSV
jgi:hypothetical protein